MATTSTWRVIGSRGCGSVIAEAALTLAGEPYQREQLDYTDPAGLARIKQVNPLGQVPALIAPDGGVMTETAAVVLHLDDLYPHAKLLPARTDPLRRDALRWLVFLVAAVYPTFTYGDDPKKWVGPDPDKGGDALRASTDAHRASLYKQLEAAAVGPWFLGDAFSMIDVYLTAMTYWRPRKTWFARETPKIAAIAAACEKDPRLVTVWKENF